MSTQPITNSRAFELVSRDELVSVKAAICQRKRYPAIEQAVQYLTDKHEGAAVRVKVMVKANLKRMRESALGYANRRGFMVSTRHLNGWLYLEKMPW